MAEVLGIESREGRLRPDLLDVAEEIFFSATPIKVLPVRQVEDRVLTGVPGPLSRRFSTLMNEIVSGRDERFKKWLFPVE